MLFSRDRMRKLRSAFKVGLQAMYEDRVPGAVKGEIFLKMWDPDTGEVGAEWHHTNVITLDASLIVARLMKDPAEPPHGINMLAVGTGANGSLLNPDLPPKEQRRLNNEIDRKTFSETTFRDPEGNAVAIPTNVVDFTTVFSQAEAVGPLNEMGLMSTISDNRLTLNLNPNAAGQGGQTYDPTVDSAQYDNLVNYHTFGVISKPNNMVLGITWRLTF